MVLPRFVLEAIEEHLAEFVGGDPDGPLFPGELGGIVSDGWFQREWRRSAAKAASEPANVAGFSRARADDPLPDPDSGSQKPPETLVAVEYPQRDSNPCRHLESSIEVVRRVRLVHSRPSRQVRPSV